MIRTDLVEVIQQSAEDLKESFDFDSSIGHGIQEMTSRGKGMLLAFQDPSNELVKLFDRVTKAVTGTNDKTWMDQNTKHCPKCKKIAVAEIPDKGLGKTINDRLRRAIK